MLDSVEICEEYNSVANLSIPVQYMSGDELARLGITNAADALKRMSGVHVKDYGGIGGMKTVSIRGMGAHHTAVFYDGVAVGDCQSGQVDMGRFSTDNIDGLQLAIGQSDDIYSSARMAAAAGAVYMETRIPSKNYIKIGERVSSFDTYQTTAQIGRVFGKGWCASMFGDYIKSNGEYDFSIRNAQKSIDGKRINSDIECVRTEMNLSWSDSDTHTLRTKLYGYFSTRGIPGAVIVDNSYSSERLHSDNLFAQMYYEFIASAAFKAKFTLKHNYTYDKYTQPLLGNDKSYDEYKQRETDFSATLKWLPSFLSGVSIGWSSELFHNNLTTTNSHNVMSSVPQRITLLSLLNIRYSSELFCATASLLHTDAWEWASKGDVAPNRHHLSPSLSLSIYPSVEGLSLRASYKEMFRMPTFNDLYYRETGNYLLRPEKNRMLNIGATYSLQTAGMIESLLIKADAYRGKVEDKIVAIPGIFVWKMSNINDVLLHGVDANISANISLGAKEKVEFSTSYSYMKAIDDTDGSSVKGEQIVYTPRHSGSASLLFLNRYVDVGYSLIWSDKRYRLPQNISSNIVDAYYDHSIWLSRIWRFNKCQLTTKIEAMNLSDKNYEIIRYYPMPGRNFRFTAIFEI